MAHSRFRTAVGSVAAVVLASAMLPIGAALAKADDSPKHAEFYELQWNLKAMRAHPVFSAGPHRDGSPEVLVAVVDTGIDYTHPDLGIRRNPDGSAGNGGLVDLSLSTSFLSRPSACPSGEPGTPYRPIGPDFLDESVSNPAGMHRVTDFHSHGTAVSGLIASQARLLAGVTQRTTLFGVKVHGMSRQNCLGVYLQGIRYAADKGADVIHLSIPLEWDTTDPRFPNAVAMTQAALDYAHERGAVLVVAAGNNAANLNEGTRFRFCQAEHVFCVSATGPASPELVKKPYWDEPAAYTNFGRAIDVAGAGGTGTFPNQIVPVWLTCSQVSRVQTGAAAACGPGDPQIWPSTGTSFAAAATSGLAALLVSLRPGDTPEQIESLIERSADDLGEPGDDWYYGEGRIDVQSAVAHAVSNRP